MHYEETKADQDYRQYKLGDSIITLELHGDRWSNALDKINGREQWR